MYKALKEIMDENPGQVHPKTTYKTGFKELDQIIQGFTSTDLVLIAAKPGNCGNIFLKNLGVRMSNDIPVLFINTEKDAFTYAKDLESIVTSVPENSGLDEMQGPTSDIFIESDAKFPKEIDKTIGQFKREHPDEAIVLIDNMNGVFFSQEAGNYTYEKQAFEISGSLKMLTLKHQVPILVYHRTGTNDFADASNPAAPVDIHFLEESNNRFDLILSVYRPEYYRINMDENGLPIEYKLYIHALRNNTGIRGKVVMKISEENRFLLIDD